VIHPAVAAGTAFLASALEFVEAATIVMAVGYTAGWNVALRATAWACAVLVLLTFTLGPALVYLVPLETLEIAIGVFLTLFGYTWLRKAIWRYAGRKPMRNEDAAFASHLAELRKHERRYAFVTAFNGVLLEGLEVAVIVITFAAGRSGSLWWAAAGALAAGALVAALAVALRHPFSRVPENLMGFVVGVMLLTFGTYWSGEGLGILWWAGDATLAWIAATYAGTALLLIAAQRAGATAS
jgi:uncharacterized membrane protein